MAEARRVPLLRVEDAFLRSIHPGRSGTPPLGLLIDAEGVHFDASNPPGWSAFSLRTLWTIMLFYNGQGQEFPVFAPQTYQNAIILIQTSPPPPGYVLVIDQTEDDASVRFGGATPAAFREMLATLRSNIRARAHPDQDPRDLRRISTRLFRPEHCDPRTELVIDPVSPWALLAEAQSLSTPCLRNSGWKRFSAEPQTRIFGQPFYAGWGLTVDENPVPRRRRRLTRAQLFAAAYILAPTWFDPCRNRICSFEEAVDAARPRCRTRREDRFSYTAGSMRLWKRAPCAGFLASMRACGFPTAPAPSAPLVGH
ncbi:MAG: hypothetical protein R3D78_02125 [Paracoccaceae bacterium]